MEMIDCTPNVDGLLRWLQNAYRSGNKDYAVRVLTAGWPTLCDADAVCVLEGWNSLGDMLDMRAIRTAEGSNG